MFKERLSGFIKKEMLTLADHSIVSDFNYEIEDCIEYFEKSTPNFHENKSHLRLVHGGKVEIGKIKDKEREFFLVREPGFEQGYPFFKETYCVNKGRVVKIKKNHDSGKIIGNSEGEAIDRRKLEEIVTEIHNITIPYSNHIKLNKK